MQSYINKNTWLRTQAQSDFEKDFFKLMNNSVFGKTMENVRNRTTAFLLRHELDPMAAFPECELLFVKMYKTKTVFKKPIYCSVSILDLSKKLMYDFYYNHLKRDYQDRVNLLYTDPDSLILSIYTKDVYANMKKTREFA